MTAAELTTWDTTTPHARRPARVAAPLSQRREVVVSGDMSCIMIRSDGSVNDPMRVGLEASVAARRSPPRRSADAQRPERCQGPQIAIVKAGLPWMFTNSVPPSGENVAPANSPSPEVLNANGNTWPAASIPIRY
jgi:hypothetical protein